MQVDEIRGVEGRRVSNEGEGEARVNDRNVDPSISSACGDVGPSGDRGREGEGEEGEEGGRRGRVWGPPPPSLESAAGPRAGRARS